MKQQQKQDNLEKYLPLIKYLADKYFKYIPLEMEFDDLVQAGFVGLLKANLKYDKSRNVKFLTYAEHRIVGEMFDEVRKFQKLSRTYFNQKKNLNNAYKTLYMSLNCKPDSEKVAEYLNISLDEYYSMVFYTNLSIISIDDDTSYWISNISSNDFNPEEYIIYFDSITSVKDTVKYLPDDEQDIIKMRFFNNMTLNQISKNTGKSITTVFNMQNRALSRLKKIIVSKQTEV